MTRNDYEYRQEERRRRLLERAEKAQAEGQAAHNSADRIARAIPMGQPILVGHHSERRHRRDLDRIDRGMRKAIEKSKEAQELRQRAEAVGTGGISSDDPEAVQKLQTKREDLERRREWMKKVNAAWRGAGKPEPNAAREVWMKVGEAVGMEPSVLDQLRLDMAKRWHFQPGAPFPSYSLSNLSADVRRVRVRIEDLKRASVATPSETDHGVCRVASNVEENRIQLLFDGKPPEATRTLLKRWGFRWSPMASAWQRHLNDGGCIAAQCVVDALKKEVPHGN